MQHSRGQDASAVEMTLREQLGQMAQSSASAPPPYPPPPAGHHSDQGQPYPQQSDSASPHDHNLDPNVTGQHINYAMSGDNSIDEAMQDRGKGKRELSTSKRAAQNRAAQRAFRQRKEGYIKKLEEQVKDFQAMEQNYKALQNENYQLREYILNLQSRLLENQADFPPAPSHVNLTATAPLQNTAAAESAYAAEQQLRREMEGRPPPAPVVAREDQHDGLSQLQAAAAAQEGRPRSSPYGLGNEYPAHQPQTQPQPVSRPADGDNKPIS